MKRIFAVLSLVVGLVLTGCAKMDLAATVGDNEITLEQLQGQVDSILAEREAVDTSQMQLESGAGLTRSQLSYMISNILIDEIAQEQGVEITTADLDAYRLQIIQSIGGEKMLPSVLVNASVPAAGLETVLRRDLILQRISAAAKQAGADDATANQVIQKLVAEKSAAITIEINPRYGKWDPDSFSIVPADAAGDAVTD